MGLIPVFPSATFPNHYAIATGLYAAYHGIIYNRFSDSSNSSDTFSPGNNDPKWWFGEPLWDTVVKNGLKAATYFWPGSEVKKGDWTCPENLCGIFSSRGPFEDRVDTVLKLFDSPRSNEIPSFISLYFEEPDGQGHDFGPDHPNVTQAVAKIDSMIGRLTKGLEKRGIFEDVNIILVGDHGMVSICVEKYIILTDLAPWVEIQEDWVVFSGEVLGIRPANEFSTSEVVAKMNEGLKSGNVTNGQFLKVYLKEDLPNRLQYVDSERIPPIIGLLEEGYTVEYSEPGWACGGAHGYDNQLFSMRSIFIAHGPRFARGRKVQSFENVQIYNVITSILNIKGAPNNGTASFANSILLPTH